MVVVDLLEETEAIEVIEAIEVTGGIEVIEVTGGIEVIEVTGGIEVIEEIEVDIIQVVDHPEQENLLVHKMFVMNVEVSLIK
jgi:hypothetical protein